MIKQLSLPNQSASIRRVPPNDMDNVFKCRKYSSGVGAISRNLWKWVIKVLFDLWRKIFPANSSVIE